MAHKKSKVLGSKKPGGRSTRVVGKHAGRNAGDTVTFQRSKGPSHKEFPINVPKDRGSKNNTRIGKLTRAKRK